MAAKRFLDETDDKDPDKPNEKIFRATPSFASVIGEMVMVKNIQNPFSSLEPLLRRVVTEEVERAIRSHSRSITRSPSLRIQAPEQPSTLQLIFRKQLSVPVFTASKILDIENNPLQVLLVDKNGDQMIPTSLPHSLKLEIVVLDGDFPPGDCDTWTADEFNSKIVKERTGKRPLLTGELNITLRDGIAPVGDLEFTDNSSWIRSRKFRVAVRVVPGSYQGARIREGFTEALMVKDHRGELYKKHHPPMLSDEIWRLEKIGKDGAYHKKLAAAGIQTVQDFLKLFVVDSLKLRKILGVGMSEKMWEVTIKHARTCEMGNKFYTFRGHHFALVLNPICQVVRAEINGQLYPTKDLTNINRSYIEKLVTEAYTRWNSLEVTEGFSNDVALLMQGEMAEQYPNNQQASIVAYDQNAYLSDRPVEINYGESNANNVGCSSDYNWLMNATYTPSPFGNGIPYTMSESSSDGDITPSRAFINGG
ncbi:Calmodulin-binding-like protein [Quillaja saponaria]|uniref:Calmodulin-binding-like protein n=1 Tax=Quillaja saponaria TaxID=32244 RepID=A0AAD7Q5Y7_QUISA|nr:Calmodulin-binding-like protein [Quillaja saponaria]